MPNAQTILALTLLYCWSLANSTEHLAETQNIFLHFFIFVSQKKHCLIPLQLPAGCCLFSDFFPCLKASKRYPRPYPFMGHALQVHLDLQFLLRRIGFRCKLLLFLFFSFFLSLAGPLTTTTTCGFTALSISNTIEEVSSLRSCTILPV